MLFALNIKCMFLSKHFSMLLIISSFYFHQKPNFEKKNDILRLRYVDN